MTLLQADCRRQRGKRLETRIFTGLLPIVSAHNVCRDRRANLINYRFANSSLKIRLRFGSKPGKLLIPTSRRYAHAHRDPSSLPPTFRSQTMLVIPGAASKDTCDGVTRRDLLRVGGSGILGITLGDLLTLQKASANPAAKGEAGNGPGFGKAKSVIFVYLQGGPSHLDLWDPKDNVPDKVKSIFKPIPTKTAGHAGHGTAAEDRAGPRQDHPHPHDELHPQRALQPHRRHLPDAHRLHHRQGERLGATGTSQSQGLPHARLATSSSSSRRPSPCCRS